MYDTMDEFEILEFRGRVAACARKLLGYFATENSSSARKEGKRKRQEALASLSTRVSVVRAAAGSE